MKRITKLITNLIAVLMLFTFSLSLVGCGDIRGLELKVSVYNYSTSEVEERTLTVDLYRHLAPNTVDAIIKKAKEDFYDNTFFYKLDGYSRQLMFGDLKANTLTTTNDYMEVTQNYSDYIDYSEFSNGGTVGSNLTNTKGHVGLWRTWEVKGSYSSSSNALKTSRGAWYVPTASLSSYNDWFCVFGTIDFSKEENSETLSLIEKALADSQNQEYVIYYTGTYDYDDSVMNNGLTFHCEFKNEYDQKAVDEEFRNTVFVADENSSQYECYNERTIYVPVARKVVTGFDATDLAVRVTDVVVR